MPQVIMITTPTILNVTVNCYLIKIDDGFILIDTGLSNQRHLIEQALQNAGCQSGKLKRIILTHGDFDHSGNAAYLREKFQTPVAMHRDDAGMVERGDMFWNRKSANWLVKTLTGLMFSLRAADRFKPDLLIDEGDDFSALDFEAKIIALPGHSRGQIGVLTGDGDLFCGDLLANTKKPEVGSLVDDAAAMQASVKKLKGFTINTVYPGHGKPFPMRLFLESQQGY
ncbi:MAG TPA: MBL fold metallo-hydrolase [Phototrophicaceae bacterium]|nr:MBL fold metallo-hydrolase [Phototrophicaceae bacterium]